MLDISAYGLGIGLLLMLLPLYFLHKYRTGLTRSTVGATVRMFIQLYLVGLYIEFLFTYDCWYVNLLWGLVMVFVATVTAVQRIRLRPSVLVIPIGVAFLFTSLLVTFYFLGLVLGIAGRENMEVNELFTARYFIPVFGLLLGNMLGVCVVALTSFFDSLLREQQQYYYLLGNGATVSEATAPFLRSAIIKAFNPCIANMSVMGLVAMPGTMIGQILGGSSPILAIRYQMMIVVITFVASMLSLIITILLSKHRCFDVYGRIFPIYLNEK